MNGNYSPKKHNIKFYLFAGLVGFFIGFYVYPTHQSSVESAQVLANIVRYPNHNNPMYIYHKKLWSLINQITAVFLYYGISEIMLCKITSGIAGALFFLYSTLLMQLFAADYLIAFAAPFILLMLSNFSGLLQGFNYYIHFINTFATFGMIGFSWCLIAIALISHKKFKNGLFLCGLAPAIHPSLGVWLNLAAIISLLLFYNLKFLKKYFHYLFLGYLLTLISWICHYVFFMPKNDIDKTIKSQYLNAFIKYWDIHREKKLIITSNFIFLICGVIIISIILKKLKKKYDFSFLMFLNIIFFLIGIIAIIISKYSPSSYIENYIQILMPIRIFNFSFILTIFIIFGLIIFCANKIMQTNRKQLLTTLTALKISVVIFLLIISIKKFINLKQNNVLEFWTNNKVLETARKINSGFLLTSAELPLMQLKTRTALLIDCDQLDLLPYTLEASLIIDDILKNIYNIDLFNPPQSILKNKQPFIPYYENKKNWERKNIEEWQNFKKKYNISSILTHNDYSLNLPIIIQDEKYILYGIP